MYYLELYRFQLKNPYEIYFSSFREQTQSINVKSARETLCLRDLPQTSSCNKTNSNNRLFVVVVAKRNARIAE